MDGDLPNLSATEFSVRLNFLIIPRSNGVYFARVGATSCGRVVGTQTCKTLAASAQVDKQFAQFNLTGYLHQASDDPSRKIADAILTQTVLDVCKSNLDKTIDQAVTLAIVSLPATEVKTPP